MNLETWLIVITTVGLMAGALYVVRNQRQAQKKQVKRFLSTYVAPPLPGLIEQRRNVRQTAFVCGGRSKYEYPINAFDTVEWEGKGIFEQLDEHRKGVKPLVNNEEKNEKP